MAGSLTVTLLTKTKIILDWTSDGDGNADANIVSTYKTAFSASSNSPLPSKIVGYIVGIETVPGANGDLATTLPSNLYDITLDDPYDYDLAGDNLANCSGTVADKKVPNQPVPVDSEVTLEVSNAGDTKTGRLIIYLKEA